MDAGSPRTRLLDQIDATRARWQQLVADVPADRMEEPGAMGAWTFKDVASHVTAWRRKTIARLEAAGRGEPMPALPWPEELGEDEDDPINAWIHDRTKDRPLTEALADADASYDDLAAAINALTDEDLRDPDRFPWLTGTALEDVDFASHLRTHEADVRRWLEGL